MLRRLLATLTLGVLLTTLFPIGIANAAKPVIGGAASQAITIPEGTTEITTITATDAESDSIEYSIIQWSAAQAADADLVSIGSTSGVLSLKKPHYYEEGAHTAGGLVRPDVSRNNIYYFKVVATAGGETDTLNVTLNISKNATPIISGGNTHEIVTVDENTTDVLYSVTSTDAENDTLTYSLTGTTTYPDVDDFVLTTTASGANISFKNTPDFENPTDHNTNNIYAVYVLVNDTFGNTDQQLLYVTVKNIDDNASKFTVKMDTPNGGTGPFDVTVVCNGGLVVNETIQLNGGESKEYIFSSEVNVNCTTISVLTTEQKQNFTTAVANDQTAAANGTMYHRPANLTTYDLSGKTVTITNTRIANATVKIKVESVDENGDSSDGGKGPFKVKLICNTTGEGVTTREFTIANNGETTASIPGNVNSNCYIRQTLEGEQIGFFKVKYSDTQWGDNGTAYHRPNDLTRYNLADQTFIVKNIYIPTEVVKFDVAKVVKDGNDGGKGPFNINITCTNGDEYDFEMAHGDVESFYYEKGKTMDCSAIEKLTTEQEGFFKVTKGDTFGPSNARMLGNSSDSTVSNGTLAAGISYTSGTFEVYNEYVPTEVVKFDVAKVVKDGNDGGKGPFNINVTCTNGDEYDFEMAHGDVESFYYEKGKTMDCSVTEKLTTEQEGFFKVTKGDTFGPSNARMLGNSSDSTMSNGTLAAGVAYASGTFEVYNEFIETGVIGVKIKKNLPNGGSDKGPFEVTMTCNEGGVIKKYEFGLNGGETETIYIDKKKNANCYVRETLSAEQKEVFTLAYTDDQGAENGVAYHRPANLATYNLEGKTFTVTNSYKTPNMSTFYVEALVEDSEEEEGPFAVSVKCSDGQTRNFSLMAGQVKSFEYESEKAIDCVVSQKLTSAQNTVYFMKERTDTSGTENGRIYSSKAVNVDDEKFTIVNAKIPTGKSIFYVEKEVVDGTEDEGPFAISVKCSGGVVHSFSLSNGSRGYFEYDKDALMDCIVSEALTASQTASYESSVGDTYSSLTDGRITVAQASIAHQAVFTVTNTKKTTTTPPTTGGEVGGGDSGIETSATNCNTTGPIIHNYSSYSVAENTTAVTSMSSTHPENKVLTYSLSGGEDEEKFTLVGEQLVFSKAPDYEIPTDNGYDNIYVVSFTSVDTEGCSTTKTLSVTVTDSDETAVAQEIAVTETSEEKVGEFMYTKNGGYSNPRCHTIDVVKDFDALTADVTCEGNTNVDTYKIDCGNGDVKLIDGGVKTVNYLCKYDNKDTEYRAKCSTSGTKTTDPAKVNSSVFACSQKFTFNKSIEAQREIDNNRVKETESYIIVGEEEAEEKEEEKVSPIVPTENTDENVFSKIEDDNQQHLDDLKRLDELDALDREKGENGIKAFPKHLPKVGTPSSLTSKIASPALRKVVEMDLPESVGELAGNTNAEMSFWKQGVVEQDRDRNAYIVVPSTGLVIPLNDVPKGNQYYTDMVEGKAVDINTYLQDGASVYAGTETSGFGKVGTPVIYGHSSYWKKQPGRYKTHFQTIIGLSEGKEIWVYEKMNDNEYKRYRYQVEKSYETTSDDFSILSPGTGRNLRLMTCTPIGGTSGRWVVNAVYIDEEQEELRRKLNGSNFGKIYMDLVESSIADIRRMEKDLRKQEILDKYQALLNLEKNGQHIKLQGFITYFKTRLAREYHLVD